MNTPSQKAISAHRDRLAARPEGVGRLPTPACTKCAFIQRTRSETCPQHRDVEAEVAPGSASSIWRETALSNDSQQSVVPSR